MPRKTMRQKLDEAHAALAAAQDNLSHAQGKCVNQDNTIIKQVKQIEELKGEVRWFKQLVQNYSEALNNYFRARS